MCNSCNPHEITVGCTETKSRLGSDYRGVIPFLANHHSGHLHDEWSRWALALCRSLEPHRACQSRQSLGGAAPSTINSQIPARRIKRWITFAPGTAPAQYGLSLPSCFAAPRSVLSVTIGMECVYGVMKPSTRHVAPNR